MPDLVIEFEVPKTGLTTGQGPQIVAEEMLGAVEYSLNVAQSEIVPRTPVDRGLLRGGVQTSITGQGIDLVGRVFNPLGYALPVEAGSRPHFPPPEALEGWVRRVLRVAPKEVRGVAFLVARAIARRGTRPREFFKRGFAAARPRIELRLQQALVRIKTRLVS